MVEGDTVRNVPPPADAKPMPSTFRPSFIGPYDSTNVLIEDIKIRNTPFWIVHPVSSTNVLIRDLDIYSDKTKDFETGGWNNDDGLDPESSKNVVLERNHVTVSDDGGAIKAGRNVNGREHRAPSEDIIIRHSVYNNDGGGSAAVSMGSEMSGSIRNVFIHDNEFGGPGLSLAMKIKTNSNRGGVVENIYMRDCVLKKAISGMVQFDGNYSETVPFPNADIYNPTIRNIYLDNVDTAPDMTPGKTTFQFSSAASRSPVENVYYRNSDFYTTSTLGSAFSRNKNIKNFVVQDVSFVNPSSGARTVYNTTPLNLLDETKAVTGSGSTVPLTAASIERPDVITEVPGCDVLPAGQGRPEHLPDVPRERDGAGLPRPERHGRPRPARARRDLHHRPDHPGRQPELVPGPALRRGELLRRAININTMVYQVRASPPG